MGSHEPADQLDWLERSFTPWLETLPAGRILWIAGNHDFGCQRLDFKRLIKQRGIGGEYLIDEVAEVDGVRIFGSPWVPNLPSWAFNAPDDRFRELADQMPQAEILMLHGPPHGILDRVLGRGSVGAPHVMDAIKRIKPSHVVFGHIHEGYGEEIRAGIHFHNVSYMDELYTPGNPPHVFEI